MELRGLRSLVALAELGSIRRTAEKLNLSPAAIHTQLKVLESEMGVRLYEKVGRQLRLTQVAELLLPQIKTLLAQYDSIVSVLNEWKGLKRGLIRIGAGPTVSSYILPSLLEEFRRMFPDVKLLVETGMTPPLIENLSNGSLDLILLVASEYLEQSNLSIKATWDFEIVIVSGQRQIPRRCSITELRQLPFILHKKGSVFENLIDRYFAEVGFRPQDVIMRFDNAEAIKAMIRSGLGISMLPAWTVEQELKDKTLLLVRQNESPLFAKIALVTRKVSHLPQPVGAFIKVARTWKWKNLHVSSQ